MNRSLLFPAALGVSALLHLLVLFFGPYSPARPSPQQAEPIPVRLQQWPRPAPSPPAAARRTAAAPQTLRPEQLPPPLPAEPEPPRPAPDAPLKLAPAEAASAAIPSEAASPQTTVGGPPDGADSGAAGGAGAELTAEIAAIQAVLASLRARVVKRILYPPLARARDWQGTVLLAVVLDAQGRLESLVVRRSSGYTVLDRAAAALLKEVTPVPNPLGRPLAFDFPIEYALKESAPP